MQNRFYWLFVFFFISSLSLGQHDKTTLLVHQKHVQYIDSILERGSLQKFQLPNMHYCGGGVTGYFLDSTLLYIDAHYGAELGYAEQKVYWMDNRIIKIVYQEYSAEWEIYEEKYPPEEFEWDESKMTYTDKTYFIEIVGNSFIIKGMKDGKEFTLDPKMEFFENLQECGRSMKFFLDRDFLGKE